MIPKSDIARAIRAARKRAGLKQKELAERIGTTPQAVGQYERGLRTPSCARLEIIAEVLGTEASLIMSEAKGMRLGNTAARIEDEERDGNSGSIVEAIGSPAVLEQLAEECAELAQAALKAARIQRGENPTPVGRKMAHKMLQEEVNDVLLCIRELEKSGELEEDKNAQAHKKSRWLERIEQDRSE